MTRKRNDFQAMIDDCMAGKIDMVITKSISRQEHGRLPYSYPKIKGKEYCRVFREGEYQYPGGWRGNADHHSKQPGPGGKPELERKCPLGVCAAV